MFASLQQVGHMWLFYFFCWF